jgi:hypothetical protein
MYLHGNNLLADSIGGLMKSAINARLILGFGLLALAGARALPAAEVMHDGQEQARLLLSGRSASPHSPTSGFVSLSPTTAKSIAVDAQAQARAVILGRPIAKAPFIEADGLRAVGARRDRKAAVDPQEMARRVILGSPSAQSLPKIRLTSKPE